MCICTHFHVIEPIYLGAVERYLNFGDFLDNAAVLNSKNKIIALKQTIKRCYSAAYKYLALAGTIQADMADTALPCLNNEKLARKTRSIIAKEIKGKGDGGGRTKRFLTGISHKGHTARFDTIDSLCGKVYQLSDDFGMGVFMLSEIAQSAHEHGYGTVLCYSPLNPDKLEHVIIPALELGFVTSNSRTPYPGQPFRRIHLKTYLDTTALAHEKELKSNKKLYDNALGSAIGWLAKAKELHDRLEAIYIPAMDFARLDLLCKDIGDRIEEFAE